MRQDVIEKIKANMREIPDFPKPGVLFRDITPILADGNLFKATVGIFVDRYRGQNIEKVVGIDARGFILGAALAYALGAGFVPVRKLGKLPAEKFQESYALEYGESTLELHTDSFQPGQRVVIVDDLLATGGTAAAAAKLVQKAGATVLEVSFLIELLELAGRKKLLDFPVFSAIQY